MLNPIYSCLLCDSPQLLLACGAQQSGRIAFAEHGAALRPLHLSTAALDGGPRMLPLQVPNFGHLSRSILQDFLRFECIVV